MDKKKLVVGPGEADNEHFGEILERLRKRAGISRADAAKAIGVGSEYIRLIERGKRTPAEAHMPHILRLYGEHEPCALGDRQVLVDGHAVEFTSRIQEARGGRLTIDPSRAERIGKIVMLLSTADDAMLTRIHNLLLRS